MPAPKPSLKAVRRTDFPPRPKRADDQRSRTAFPQARLIPVPGHGPEDVVFDDAGRAITGLETGAIVAVDLDTSKTSVLGNTGGRPLGLEMLPDGRLIICDAHRGLLRMDCVTGEIEELVRTVQGKQLVFCSNATAGSDGTIWFTESTNRFTFEHYLGAVLEQRATGRLMRRDPDGSVHVLLDGLDFANGVTLTGDESAVIFAETMGPTLKRYDLASGEVTVLADNLPGYPDNVSRSADGRFWVAICNLRDKLLESLAPRPTWIRQALWALPDRFKPEGVRTTWVMAFGENGELLADLQEPRDDFHMVTGVAERGGRLVLSSIKRDGLLVLDR